MAITATKIGSSGIFLDWSYLNTPTSKFSKEQLDGAWQECMELFEKKEVSFFNSPSHLEISETEEVKSFSKKILDEKKYSDVLVIGIGGSYLGPKSVLDALDFKKNALSIHFIDNPDPTVFSQITKKLDPKKTLILGITKSGSTFETLSLLMCAWQWIGKDQIKNQTLLITDPKNGDLRKFSEEYQIQTLPIHPGLGGRFSVFSPVGMLPMELSGLDSSEFLKGAQSVVDYVKKSEFQKNGIFILAEKLLSAYPKHQTHVMMPYSTLLKDFGAWFVQLWGESLGKKEKGFTPLAALGATDQHSLLQLLKEGKDDKIVFFVTLENHPNKITTPRMLDLGFSQTFPSFERLENLELSELLKIEYQAIHKVFSRNQRLHLTLQLEDCSEKTLGSLMMFFSILTAYTGKLWEMNPFDQPGVEEGKIYIKEMLEEKKRNSSSESMSDSDRAYERLRRHREE